MPSLDILILWLLYLFFLYAELFFCLYESSNIDIPMWIQGNLLPGLDFFSSTRSRDQSILLVIIDPWSMLRYSKELWCDGWAIRLTLTITQPEEPLELPLSNPNPSVKKSSHTGHMTNNPLKTLAKSGLYSTQNIYIKVTMDFGRDALWEYGKVEGK